MDTRVSRPISLPHGGKRQWAGVTADAVGRYLEGDGFERVLQTGLGDASVTRCRRVEAEHWKEQPAERGPEEGRGQARSGAGRSGMDRSRGLSGLRTRVSTLRELKPLLPLGSQW